MRRFIFQDVLHMNHQSPLMKMYFLLIEHQTLSIHYLVSVYFFSILLLPVTYTVPKIEYFEKWQHQKVLLRQNFKKVYTQVLTYMTVGSTKTI